MVSITICLVTESWELLGVGELGGGERADRLNDWGGEGTKTAKETGDGRGWDARLPLPLFSYTPICPTPSASHSAPDSSPRP